MIISRIVPIVIEIPLATPIVTHFGSISTRTCLLVKIVTDSGHFGIGEIWNTFPNWGIYEKIATLKHGMEPLLIGQDPMNIEKLNRKLHESFHILSYHTGAIGTIHHSISGINVALWDLKGRILGKSISKLIHDSIAGNDTIAVMDSIAEKIPVYASGLSHEHLEGLVSQHRQLGITSFKRRVGHDEAKDLANLHTLRNMLDDSDNIMIDANQAWDLETTLKRLHDYKQFGLYWMEEPLISDKFEEMREVREKTGIRVTAGENYYTRSMYEVAVQNQSVDIIQPDLSKTGGISDILEIIASVKQNSDIPYAPHYLNSAVCLAASIQLFAAVPGGVMMEMDANPNPLREKLFTEPFQIENGLVTVAQRPGLGYELDEEFLRFYQRKTSLMLHI